MPLLVKCLSCTTSHDCCGVHGAEEKGRAHPCMLPHAQAMTWGQYLTERNTTKPPPPVTRFPTMVEPPRKASADSDDFDDGEVRTAGSFSTNVPRAFCLVRCGAVEALVPGWCVSESGHRIKEEEFSQRDLGESDCCPQPLHGAYRTAETVVFLSSLRLVALHAFVPCSVTAPSALALECMTWIPVPGGRCTRALEQVARDACSVDRC